MSTYMLRLFVEMRATQRITSGGDWSALSSSSSSSASLPSLMVSTVCMRVCVLVILAFINGEHNVHGCVYACMTGESTSVRVVCVIVDACDQVCIFTARKRSLGQGNIFAPVCHSVHSGGGSTWAGTPGTRYTPRARYTPQTRYTPRSSAYWEIRATSGRYASCWNAFLFTYII